jgi:hypothetical protein
MTKMLNIFCLKIVQNRTKSNKTQVYLLRATRADHAKSDLSQCSGEEMHRRPLHKTKRCKVSKEAR